MVWLLAPRLISVPVTTPCWVRPLLLLRPQLQSPPLTAVQVLKVTQPSAWQQDYQRFNRTQLELLEQAGADEGKA